MMINPVRSPYAVPVLNKTSNGVKVDEALIVILKSIEIMPAETVILVDALARVLAEDISAGFDIPALDNSAMDGYAVRTKDIISASKTCPKALEVIETVKAGSVPSRSVSENQAVRIMTGAHIPKGADSVIMVEKTRLENGKVKVLESTQLNENIRRAGEDIKKSELVLRKGRVIGPAQMGILASLGREAVAVTKMPRVGILATGDELVEIKEDTQPGKIKNSNTYSLFGQVKKAGAIPCILGIAKDDKQAIQAKIEQGLECDLLVISGGVSAGDYDYVKDVLSGMGAEISPVRDTSSSDNRLISNGVKFQKVAMKPGKPLVFGIIRGKPVFGLPGNPVSSMVSFEVFIKPVILKMSGQDQDAGNEVEAVLEEDIKKKKGLRCFLRAQTKWENGEYITRTTGPQGSGILKSMALADSLIILPEEAELIEKGTKVTVRFLPH